MGRDDIVDAGVAVGYIRVSTLEQAEEGVSLDAQRSRIEAYCQANDLALAGVHVDRGISGRKASTRPGLHAALDEVCRARGVLIAYSLSRLARSTKDMLMISERLAKAGADFVSLSEKIETTSAAGKMMFRLLAVLAEFESDLISERTKSSMALIIARGQWTGQVPYGFDLAGDGKTLIENANEQGAIAAMLHHRGQGLSYAKVAEVLDRNHPSRSGEPWDKKTVARIVARVKRRGAGPIPK